jgi:hypothetical protein
LQKRVENPSYWSKIHSCLSDGQWCDSLNKTVTTESQFNNASLTPIEVWPSLREIPHFLGIFVCSITRNSRFLTVR